MDDMNLSYTLNGDETIEELLKKGESAEELNDLEAAYEAYEKAAQLGSGKAMFAIGNLYTAKHFRMIEESNIMELMLQGIPAFPWNTVQRKVPDVKTAFEWYCKAAELDDPRSCAITGVMLCEGDGCQTDTEKGLAYLKKALSLGIENVGSIIYYYDTPTDISFSDEEYEERLRDFVTAVETKDPKRYEMYYYLKGGTPRQLTRLGHAIVTRQNLNIEPFMSFSCLFSADKIPYVPCYSRRANWTTFVSVNLDAFESDEVLITFCSDISYNLSDSCRLKTIGEAVYRSPAFGWLEEEKKAFVFKIDRQHLPNGEDMQRYIEGYRLFPEEYEKDSSAFIIENGEKEYSVEIAAITNGKVEILFRYTIGGSDDIESSFEPSLIELTLE